MSETRGKWKPDPDTAILVAVYAGAAALAAFAFGQSYKHIYDLGLGNHQDGWTAQLLPLFVDVVIVVASLILVYQRRYTQPPTGPAKWMPRVMLYVGIAATIGANALYGLPYGLETAGISAWPGVVFAGLAETVLVSVRPVQRKGAAATVIVAGQALTPANAVEAAKAAYAASVAAGNPLSGWQIHKRFGIPRSTAAKIAKPAASQLNGEDPHARTVAPSTTGA